jgi:hypothetical protein
MKGVVVSAGGGWTAELFVRGDVVTLGDFPTEDEAAFAHDEAARIHHGKYARCNSKDEFDEAGEEAAEAAAEAKRDADALAWCGEDDGVIPPGELERLWTEFQRETAALTSPCGVPLCSAVELETRSEILREHAAASSLLNPNAQPDRELQRRLGREARDKFNRLKKTLRQVGANDATLTHVNLAGLGVRTKHARRLAGLLKANAHVTSVDLSENAIGIGGARSIYSAVLSSRTLVGASLENSGIGQRHRRLIDCTLASFASQRQRRREQDTAADTAGPDSDDSDSVFQATQPTSD